MSNIWDTTKPVFEYPNNYKIVYETINSQQRKSFSDWIGKISKSFKNDLDWWSSSVSSRNTYISKLFHNICILESLQDLKKKNKFLDKVIVSSPQLKKAINIYFKKQEVHLKNDISWNTWIKNIYFIIWPLIFSISLLSFSKIIKEKKLKIKKNADNILVDLFITSANLTTDRYYNKLEKKKLNNKKNIYFVPTILSLNIFKLPTLIKKIRNNNNFILKEDFICFSDIWYAFCYISRKKKFYINYLKYKNWNLSSLIREEFYKNSNFQSILISILNYRFAQNLSNKNIKLKKVIDWFENTTVDRGWNFGFRKFYPQTKTLGYQSYTLYRQFMCKHPSKAEYLYKVIPNEIVVIGTAYKKIRKEFCKDIKVRVGPALRFDHLFSNKNNLKRKYNIFVSLNLDISVSKKILTSVINTKWAKSGKKVFIKSHPLLPLTKIISKDQIPKNFVELDDEFFKIARNSKILISAGISSSIIEALVCGCAVLMPYVDKNEYYNFKYLKIPKESYKMCKNEDQLNDDIHYFVNERELNRKKRIKKVNSLKAKLFEKTTNNNLNMFS